MPNWVDEWDVRSSRDLLSNSQRCEWTFTEQTQNCTNVERSSHVSAVFSSSSRPKKPKGPRRGTTNGKVFVGVLWNDACSVAFDCQRKQASRKRLPPLLSSSCLLFTMFDFLFFASLLFLSRVFLFLVLCLLFFPFVPSLLHPQISSFPPVFSFLFLSCRFAIVLLLQAALPAFSFLSAFSWVVFSRFLSSSSFFHNSFQCL